MITPPCINITPPRTARRKKRAMYSIINKNSFSVYRKSNRRAFCRILPAFKIPVVLLISDFSESAGGSAQCRYK